MEKSQDKTEGSHAASRSGVTGDSPEFAALFALENTKLLNQSMLKIQHCLDQLTEEQIWWRPADQLNSIGNLVLHLAGNLRQWAISGVGGAPDLRKRQAEFDQRDPISKPELLEQLATTVAEAQTVINELPRPQWTEAVTIQGFAVSKLEAISHTCTHFVGHTHQIILMTRLQLGEKYRFHWSPEMDRQHLPI